MSDSTISMQWNEMNAVGPIEMLRRSTLQLLRRTEIVAVDAQEASAACD
jgi:hypothetical protein